jgi:hypothetical protein
VALSILSIVLLSVYGTFFSINRAIYSTENNAAVYREARIFFDLIRREVEGCYLNQKDKNTFIQVKDRDIYGVSASEFLFTAFAPYGRGVYSITYRLDPDKKTLLKSVSGLWDEGEAEQINIMDNITMFKVEAFINGKWTGTFDSLVTGGMPDVLKVTLSFTFLNDTITLFQSIATRIGG